MNRPPFINVKGRDIFTIYNKEENGRSLQKKWWTWSVHKQLIRSPRETYRDVKRIKVEIGKIISQDGSKGTSKLKQTRVVPLKTWGRTNGTEARHSLTTAVNFRLEYTKVTESLVTRNKGLYDPTFRKQSVRIGQTTTTYTLLFRLGRTNFFRFFCWSVYLYNSFAKVVILSEKLFITPPVISTPSHFCFEHFSVLSPTLYIHHPSSIIYNVW